MHIEVEHVRQLRFDDGTPVRAASALARLGDGWLVAQDDGTSAAWVRPGTTTRVRAFPPVEGHDVFGSAEGTKHLKPDVEAAVEVGGGAVLLLGSGSTSRRMRAALVAHGPDGPVATVADLTPVYGSVAGALGLPLDQLNLEGACVRGGRLHWFQRGPGPASASVDLDLAEVLRAVRGESGPVAVGARTSYELGSIEGVGLAVTDALALPDGRVLVSAAAEDTPNAVDDGPVVATALVLLDGERVAAVAALPEPSGRPEKVEGLGLQELTDDGVRLVAVVDADDPDAPSAQLDLRVRW